MADYATLLRNHVTLKCRSIDRIFLQGYVPKLQSVGQVCTFLRWQRKFHIPSSAAFGKIGAEYVKAIHQFAEKHKIPVVYFERGQNKEEVARPYIEVFRFSVKWRASAPRLCRVPPLRGGDFQGIWVFRSDEGWERRERETHAPLTIVSMSPPSYPSAWLHPCRARFRFAWRSHCSAVAHGLKLPVAGG